MNMVGRKSGENQTEKLEVPFLNAAAADVLLS